MAPGRLALQRGALGARAGQRAGQAVRRALDVVQQRLVALLVDLARDHPQRQRPAGLRAGGPARRQDRLVQADRRAGVPAPAPGRLARPQERVERQAVDRQREPRAGRRHAGELDRLVLGDRREIDGIIER
jgi:hypothetical protein